MRVARILGGLVVTLGLPCLSARFVDPCGSHGLQLGIYKNQQPLNSDDTYSLFDPASYKTTVPEYGSYSGLRIGRRALGKHLRLLFPQESDRVEFVVNWRGYLQAPVTGNYTVTIKNVDDAMFFWFGRSAYIGWTRANTYLQASYSFTNMQPGQAQTIFPLLAGEYYPFRVMFAQSSGLFDFAFSITRPDGKQVVGNAKHTRFHYVQNFGCDASDNAPAFYPFGSEP